MRRLALALALVPALACLPSGAADGPRPAAAGTTETECPVEHLDAESPKAEATIDQVAWIAGHWRAEALGGTGEEFWSPPLAGAMGGFFRMVRDGEIRFYELLSLTEEEGSLVLRIRHLDPALQPWPHEKEALEFPLVRISETEAFFSGLTFLRIAEDRVRVCVNLGDGPGGQIARFDYRTYRPED